MPFNCKCKFQYRQMEQRNAKMYINHFFSFFFIFFNIYVGSFLLKRINTFIQGWFQLIKNDSDDICNVRISI